MKRIIRSLFPGSPTWRWRTTKVLKQMAKDGPAIGWRLATRIAAHDVFGIGSRKKVESTRLSGYRYPLHYRPGTSDPEVMRQVLCDCQYRCVLNSITPKYILDFGANIGFSSYYFLHQFPEARSVVVEPDSGNMAICRRNLAPFGERVTFVQAAIWPESIPLAIERGDQRDWTEWAFQVRKVRPGEIPEIQGITVSDIVKLSQFPRIDLLKMDIEGSEEQIFNRGDSSWLRNTGVLAVELHNPLCEEALSNVLSNYSCERERYGELTVIRNIVPRKSNVSTTMSESAIQSIS